MSKKKKIPLPTLREKIDKAHTRVIGKHIDAVIDAYDLGDLLEQAAYQLKCNRDGPSFQEWIKENFKFSRESAYLYRRIYKNWHKIEPNLKASRITTIEQARAFLATPREELRAKVEPTQLERCKKYLFGVFNSALKEWTEEEILRFVEYSATDPNNPELCEIYNRLLALKDEVAGVMELMPGADRESTLKRRIEFLNEATQEEADELTDFQKSVVIDASRDHEEVKAGKLSIVKKFMMYEPSGIKFHKLSNRHKEILLKEFENGERLSWLDLMDEADYRDFLNYLQY